MGHSNIFFLSLLCRCKPRDDQNRYRAVYKMTLSCAVLYASTGTPCWRDKTIHQPITGNPMTGRFDLMSI